MRGGAGVNNKDLVGRRVDRGGGDRGGATGGMRVVNTTLESNFNEISFFETLPRPGTVDYFSRYYIASFHLTSTIAIFILHPRPYPRYNLTVKVQFY